MAHASKVTKPFLIVQLRPEDEAADSEFQAIVRYGRLHDDEVVRARVERAGMPEIELGDYAAIIVGGSPFDVSTPEDEKSEIQKRIENDFTTLFERIVEPDFPFLGACSGNGLLGRFCGAFARDFGVPPDDAQDNFTDPESRIMKTSFGFDQCYNGQIAVDETTQLIVATGLTNCAADNAELLPLITRAQMPLGGVPPEVLADAGYRSEATFQTLEARGITAYISLGHEVRPAKAPNPAHVASQRMADRLTSAVGRARYRRRKAIVEPMIGWIKEVLGFRRFSLRGVAKARGEWNVVCLAVNLKRLHRIRMA